MNKPHTMASILAAPMNPLLLQSALTALSKTQLLRIMDTPAFSIWQENNKMLLFEEIKVRNDKPAQYPLHGFDVDKPTLRE